jgi:hypothetical protein
MAIVVNTNNPRGLLSAIKKAVDDDKVDTWSYDEDGDFTHTADQWNRRAWLRPHIREDRLVFNIFPPRAKTLSRVMYGIYHGRFIEMLLNHFDERFKEVSATALPTSADMVKPSDA